MGQFSQFFSLSSNYIYLTHLWAQIRLYILPTADTRNKIKKKKITRINAKKRKEKWNEEHVKHQKQICSLVILVSIKKILQHALNYHGYTVKMLFIFKWFDNTADTKKKNVYILCETRKYKQEHQPNKKINKKKKKNIIKI